MNKIKNILLFIASLAVCLLVLEGVARLLVDFDANYYAAPEIVEKNSVHRHPYGDIPVNSLGFFDEEFVADGKVAIGYFGDSVTYGVGAGYPYRFTEHLDQLRPEFHHLNVGGPIGSSLEDFQFSRLEFLRDKFDLGTIVYVMNLNDILPIYLAGKKREAARTAQGKPGSENGTSDNLRWLIRWRDRLDVLRGTSVFYTWARNVVKTYLMQQGFDAQGYRSIEQFPEENREIISAAAKAINDWGAKVQGMGVRPCVAMLPYEMQLSKDAARVYKELDIKFSGAFTDFGTQKIIASDIDGDVPYLVLGKTFPEKPVGTYFVYNLGDRIDFNHPNRAGHELIAREISESRFCF